MSLPPYPTGPEQGGSHGRPPVPPMPTQGPMPTQPAYQQRFGGPQPQPTFSPPPKPVRTRGMTWWQYLMVGVAALLAIALPASIVIYYTANARLIADRQSVADYTPSDNISSLVERADLNDVGTFIFYTSHPELNTANEFNTACGIRPEQFLLGCYTGETIHLYDVTEERLDGLREVTAAHEMLHAAFDRLDKKSQDHLGELLEKAYEEHGDDPELADRMDAYAASQPGTRITELHSIVGTEFADLDPELEAYYKRYFNDRSIVVGLHASYMKVFTDLEQQTTDLSNQILALADEIESDTNTFNADQNQLNADIDAFIAKNQAYGYSGDPAGFDADKAALIARDSELDARRTAINDKTTRLGDLQQQLRDLDADAQALNRSIDSTIVPGEGI
ncbi:proline-rich domain-containing protein [Agreia bicolorata]|uniref:proline-rich domain-containing protein n=1 Tax=Agreia bicolorata TaxID=110935 RepID=UPI001269F655|nr:proline-rich domain-containing protein [Agreia bicolorata]